MVHLFHYIIVPAKHCSKSYTADPPISLPPAGRISVQDDFEIRIFIMVSSKTV